MMPPMTFRTMATIPPIICLLRKIACAARISPMMGRKKNKRLKTNGTTMQMIPTRHAHPAEPVNCEMIPAVPPAAIRVGSTGGGVPGGWYVPGGGWYPAGGGGGDE